MRIGFTFKWYGFWIGFFWDRKKKWLYFFPIPMCGLILKFDWPDKYKKVIIPHARYRDWWDR